MIDFPEWLDLNTSLSERSIYKYSRAVMTTSREMLLRNVIGKPFVEMNPVELEINIAVVLMDPLFIAKNKTGNSMYSSALKQYRLFRKDSVDINDANVITDAIGVEFFSTTEREEIIKARIGQGKFRELILNKYGEKCIISGLDNPRLLLASHIKPWAMSSNSERLDSENGLCLSPTFDRLFDIGLITFSAKGKLYVSSMVGKENMHRLNVSRSKNYDIKPTRGLCAYMEYHRDVIYMGRNDYRSTKKKLPL